MYADILEACTHALGERERILHFRGVFFLNLVIVLSYL